jgi:RNA polymerase sigma-70 factor, ECF subfamily
MKPGSSRRNQPPAASNSSGGSLSWTDTQEVAEVIEACQKGDQDAQRRLYDETYQNVYRLMVRMIGIQDASDLTQQVFFQAFRKIAQFSGQSKFSTWLYRVAVNEALQHIRRSKRLQAQVLEKEPLDRSPDSYENVDDKDVLEQALGLLDPDLRSTFLLREVEGLSYSEMAEALQIPEGTIGSRLNRARRELKQHIIELGWEP